MRHPSLLVLLAGLVLLAALAAVPATALDGFVGCAASDDCWSFALGTHQIGPALPLMGWGALPHDATVTPDGYEVWFVGALGDGVVVRSRSSTALVAIIPVAGYPIGVAFDADGSRAFVSSHEESSLSIIDTATYGVIGTLSLPVAGGNLALSPASGNLYVAQWSGPRLCEVAPDGGSILREADLGSALWQVVAAPGGQHAFVTDRGTNEVLEVALATLTVSRSFAVGLDPWGLDITADGALLVVTCEDDAVVMLIDLAAAAITTVPLDPSADPRDVDILDEAGLAYVAGGTATGYQSPVYVIDLQSAAVVETLDGPGDDANVIAVQAQMHEGPTAAPAPRARAALAAHPNPFNPRVTVSWSLGDAGAGADGEVAVYDLAGRHLRTLARGDLGRGPRSASWDGRDASGRSLPGGTYLVRLRAGGAEAIRKVVLAR